MEQQLLHYLIAAIVAVAIFTLIDFITFKKRQNEKSQKNKTHQKLLRFTRGNKTLTPEQQKELFYLNKKNLDTLKNEWKNEHL